MKIPFGRRDAPQHPNTTVSGINQIGERTARGLDDAGAASRSRQFDLDRIIISERVECEGAGPSTGAATPTQPLVSNGPRVLAPRSPGWNGLEMT